MSTHLYVPSESRRWRLFALAVVAALGVLWIVVSAPSAGASSDIVFDGSPGTAAPPAKLGPYTMAPFTADSRPELTQVTTVPAPGGGELTFDHTLEHDRVPTSWNTWSHGYTGDVYCGTTSVYPCGAGPQDTLTMTLPQGTVAFYFYAETWDFGAFVVTATASGGATLSTSVAAEGNSGAHYIGFYSPNGTALTSITVTQPGNTSNGFTVGEFGIAYSQAVTLGAAPTTLPGLLQDAGFENGTLDGWTANVVCDPATPDYDGGPCGDVPGYVQAVQSFAPTAGTHGPGPNGADNFPAYTAPSGKWFAVLQPGCRVSTLSQTFKVPAGQTLSGWAFFATDEDGTPPYLDYGSVTIMQGNATVATVLDKSVPDVGPFNGTPWIPFSYTFAVGGTYTLHAQVTTVANCEWPSWIGLDLAMPPPDDTSVTPDTQSPGGYIKIHSSGLSGASSVLIDGVPSPSFQVIDDDTILALVPDGVATGPVDVTVISPADGYFTIPAAFMATASGTTPPPPACGPSTPITLEGQWSLIAWPGPDDISVAAALGDCAAATQTESAGEDQAVFKGSSTSIADQISAIWTYDAAAGHWLAWFPNGGASNDLTTLHVNTAYFVALNNPAAGPVTWQ